MNEILIIVTLLLTFGSVLLWYRVFGSTGLYGLTAFLTIAANIEVVIMVKAFGMEMTLGNMLFAGTFLATDILSEVHGKGAASKCAKMGILTSLSMIVLSNIWLHYIPSESDFVYPAVVTVFSNTPRVLIASLVVFAICQLVDVKLYHFIWKLSGNNESKMWLRNNGATLISQALNAILFNYGAFYGTVSTATLWSIIGSSFAIFIVTSLLDTPVLYAARRIAKNQHYGHYGVVR